VEYIHDDDDDAISCTDSSGPQIKETCWPVQKIFRTELLQYLIMYVYFQVIIFEYSKCVNDHIWSGIFFSEHSFINSIFLKLFITFYKKRSLDNNIIPLSNSHYC